MKEDDCVAGREARESGKYFAKLQRTQDLMLATTGGSADILTGQLPWLAHADWNEMATMAQSSAMSGPNMAIIWSANSSLPCARVTMTITPIKNHPN